MKKSLLLFVVFGLLTAMENAYAQNPYVKIAGRTVKPRDTSRGIEANMFSLQAHEKYIDSIGIQNPNLPLQYDRWIAAYPDSAIIPFAIGKAYEEHQDDRCVGYLKIATKIKPDLAEAWEHLSFNASMNGKNDDALDYMQQATAKAPKNADYAFYYALLYKNRDQVKFDSLMLNVAYRFHDNNRGAEALYYLTSIPYNAAEKVSYYNALFDLFSKSDSAWFRTGMLDYYDYLINSTPGKAFDLALKMVLTEKTNRQDWKQRIAVAHKMVDAQSFLDKGLPDSASHILNSINLDNKMAGRKIDADETLLVLKTSAIEALGDKNAIGDAYNNLISFYSSQPSDRIRTVLDDVAGKLNFSSSKVDSDVRKTRTSAAWAVKNFTLENMIDHKQVSIGNYKGKVVLLTFWFPSCGPCNEEMTHFEAVKKRIDTGSFVYLAVNGYKSEDKYVVPFMQSQRYTFIPLRDEANKLKGNLPYVQSFPTSFLIDQNGKVMFSNFLITDKNERTLELMINDLLKTNGDRKASIDVNADEGQKAKEAFASKTSSNISTIVKPQK